MKASKIFAALFYASLLISPSVRADENSAKEALFYRLEEAGISLVGVSKEKTTSEKTPVKGIYALRDEKGLIAFTNESGELWGDGHGFQRIDTTSKQKLIKLTPREHEELWREIFIQLDDSMFPIQRTMGKTPIRNALLFSSMDCSLCYRLELFIDKHKESGNINFLVYPFDSSGGPSSPKVKKIICSKNPSLEWEKYWRERRLPAQGESECPQAEQFVRRMNDLYQIMRGASVGMGSGDLFIPPPAIFNESGSKILPMTHINKGQEAFLKIIAPPLEITKPKWTSIEIGQ